MKKSNDSVGAAEVPASVTPSFSEPVASVGLDALERRPPEPHREKHGGTRSVPLDYVIDQEQRLITITGGYADAEEWKMLLGRVLNDPRHESGFAFLRDLRRVPVSTDPEQIARVTEAIRAFWPHLQPCRGAVVTAGRSEMAALGADALAITHRLPVRMFESYQAAVTWLQSGT
jgi:hypothetical protein